MEKMIRVKRANVVLTIKESAADRYLAKGFSILDAEGNIVKKAIPGTVGELQLAYAEHLQKIEEQKKQLEEMEVKYEELKVKYDEIVAAKEKTKRATKKKAEEVTE